MHIVLPVTKVDLMPWEFSTSRLKQNRCTKLKTSVNYNNIMMDDT